MAEKEPQKFIFYMHKMSKIYPGGKEVLKDISCRSTTAPKLELSARTEVENQHC